MTQPNRYRSAADVIRGYLRSQGTTDVAAARRCGLPTGTLKSYLAGKSAPQADTAQREALRSGLPPKIFDRYWALIEGARTHTALPTFATVNRLIESGRLGEADVLLTTLMDSPEAKQAKTEYAGAAIRLGRRCLAVATHRRKHQSKDRGRGMFWCDEGLDTALSEGIPEAEAIELVQSCAAAFHSVHMYEESRAALRDGLERYHNAAELWRRLGVTAWYDGELLDALAYLACARAYRSPAPRVAHSRGQVLAELGDYPAAIRELDIAIKEPLSRLTQGYAYSCKSYALFLDNRIDEAADAEQEALDRAPGNAWHYYRKGLIESLWNPAAARMYLRKSLVLDSPSLNPRRKKHAKALLRSLDGA